MLRFWRIQKSSNDEFEELVRPHLEHLYRLAYRFCAHREDAQDLIQDLLLKLFPRQSEMKRIENLKPWLARVLYHLYIDKRRQKDRAPPLFDHDDLDDHAPEHEDPSRSPEMAVNNSLLQKQLLKAMQRINEDQRSLLILHDIEEYTLPELAIVLDTPIGTLKSRLHRARAVLREKLQKKMEPLSDQQRVNRVSR